MDDYNFEEFVSVGTRYNMFITLGKSERFYLGSAFCRKYEIERMAGVTLMYDKAKKAVGFKFHKEKTEGSIGLKKMQDGSFYINAKAFLGMYDIVPAKKYASRYIPKEVARNDGSKIFVIELKENKEEEGDTSEVL
jgi:hypothetical protein